jgi:beta-lactamase regulating signal transducer with metallopeptidase domain
MVLSAGRTSDAVAIVSDEIAAVADVSIPTGAGSTVPADVPERNAMLLARDAVRGAISAAAGAAARMQMQLLALWAAASVILLLRIAATWASIARRRRAWTPRSVDGMNVLISEDVGPAVVGLRTSRIVLPRWIVDLDDADRAMILDHEREHRNARDPILMAAAAIVRAIFPWNPALWIQDRRLRLAIETDCDSRVLSRVRDATAYGSVLLAVSERRITGSAIPTLALTEPTSMLSRRIAIMTAPAPRHPRAFAALASAIGLVALLVLLFAPAPDASAFASADASAAPDEQSQQQGRVYTADEVDVKARAEMPGSVLLPVTGGVPPESLPTMATARDSADASGSAYRLFARWVVKADGRADSNSIQVVRGDQRFVTLVRSFLLQARFIPAEKGGAKVAQLMESDFRFTRTSPSTAAVSLVAPQQLPAVSLRESATQPLRIRLVEDTTRLIVWRRDDGTFQSNPWSPASAQGGLAAGTQGRRPGMAAVTSRGDGARTRISAAGPRVR